jgi:hypothetical protein
VGLERLVFRPVQDLGVKMQDDGPGARTEIPPPVMVASMIAPPNHYIIVRFRKFTGNNACTTMLLHIELPVS